MKSKNLHIRIRVGLMAVCLTIAPAVFAQFDGNYAPANWTETLAGDPPGGGAPAEIDWSGAPASVRLVGGDDECDSFEGSSVAQPEAAGPGKVAPRADRGGAAPDDCYVEITATAPASGTVTFDYDWSTDDSGFEHFGYVLNGAFTALESGGDDTGSDSFAVNAGDVFGFQVNCTDCVEGNSEVVISGFDAPRAASAIPAAGPAGLAILVLLMAMIGLAVIRR